MEIHRFCLWSVFGVASSPVVWRASEAAGFFTGLLFSSRDNVAE